MHPKGSAEVAWELRGAFVGLLSHPWVTGDAWEQRLSAFPQSLFYSFRKKGEKDGVGGNVFTWRFHATGKIALSNFAHHGKGGSR